MPSSSSMAPSSSEASAGVSSLSAMSDDLDICVRQSGHRPLASPYCVVCITSSTQDKQKACGSAQHVRAGVSISSCPRKGSNAGSVVAGEVWASRGLTRLYAYHADRALGKRHGRTVGRRRGGR